MDPDIKYLSKRVAPLCGLQPHQYAAMTDAERVFLNVWIVVGEVGNGGYEQYFTNNSGDMAHDAIAAYKAIGAKQSAAYLAKIVKATFPNGVPSDREERSRLLDERWAKVEPLFEEANQHIYDDPEDITESLREYVDKHHAEIRKK